MILIDYGRRTESAGAVTGVDWKQRLGDRLTCHVLASQFRMCEQAIIATLEVSGTVSP
jgi:hypothetical protein